MLAANDPSTFDLSDRPAESEFEPTLANGQIAEATDRKGYLWLRFTDSSGEAHYVVIAYWE